MCKQTERIIRKVTEKASVGLFDTGFIRVENFIVSIDFQLIM